MLDGEFGGDAERSMEQETEQEMSSDNKGYRRGISVERGLVSGRGHGQRRRGRVGQQNSPYKRTYTVSGLRCLHITMAGEADHMQRREHRAAYTI